MNSESGKKIISKNKRAGFDYILLDKLEAGIELTGTEVKSIRLGKVTITDAFVTVEKNERGVLQAYINNMDIAKYSHGTYNNHEEKRKRRLLLNKKEIIDIDRNLSVKGLAVIPTSVYFKNSWIKVEIAYGKGKKLHDKRDAISEKESKKRIRDFDFD